MSTTFINIGKIENHLITIVSAFYRNSYTSLKILIETDDAGNTSVEFNPVESVTITDFYNKSQLKDKINDQLNLFLKDPFDDNPFLNKDDCKISY